MATPLTGDIHNRVETKKNGVTFHNYPQVLDTEMADVTNSLNKASISGKRLGAHVIAVNAAETEAAIYVAAGSAPADPWVPQTTLLGADQTANVVPS
jgi:hypothetical protein